MGDAAPVAGSLLAQAQNAIGKTGWWFKGQQILSTTMTILQEHYGLGNASNTRMLLAGCDAGARGAMYNLDYLANALPFQVRGFFDAPLWVSTAPFEPAVQSFTNQTALAFSLFNATQRLGQNCPKNYAAELWKCIFPQWRIPFVQTQFLVSQSSFDSADLPVLEGAPPPYNSSQQAYAVQYQSAIRATLQLLPNTQQQGSAVYSPACWKHCLSNVGNFWNVRVGAYTQKDYLARCPPRSLPTPRRPRPH